MSERNNAIVRTISVLAKARAGEHAAIGWGEAQRAAKYADNAREAMQILEQLLNEADDERSGTNHRTKNTAKSKLVTDTTKDEGKNDGS